MRSTILLLLATALFVGCVWFFAECGALFAAKDYLAGLLHVFVGFALVRAGVELARLSVLGRGRVP